MRQPQHQPPSPHLKHRLWKGGSKSFLFIPDSNWSGMLTRIIIIYIATQTVGADPPLPPRTRPTSMPAASIDRRCYSWSTLQSWDSRPHRSIHLSTTPWSGNIPKCMLAGAPNFTVIFENFTSVPPSTHIVSVVGFPNDAGPPLPVMYAGPVTTNPSLTAG